jgi:hypothetical protein
MTMLLRPGRTCDEAIQLLEGVESGSLNDVQNAIPYITPMQQGDMLVYPDYLARQAMSPVLRKYDQWTAAATAELLTVFADRSVTAPLRNGKYGYIISADPAEARTAQLLHAELGEMRTYFRELTNQLREMKERYKRHQGRSLVLDTNDLLHGQNFTKIPWTKLYGEGVVVVVPHVVVDEIDKKSYAQSDKVRRRARTVFRLLEQLLDKIDEKGHATLEDGTPFEVMEDEPEHLRLPNNDDEVVARACALQQAVAPAEVTVITFDNGMRTRAKAWKLKAAKLDEKYRIKDGDEESAVS